MRPASMILMSGLLWGAPSWALPYIVESPPYAERDAAEAGSAALDAGALVGGGSLEPTVLRRYVQGEGWRYVVQVRGVEDIGHARDVGRLLATGTSPADIIELQGRRRVTVESVSPLLQASVTPPTSSRARTAGATAPAATPGDGSDTIGDDEFVDANIAAPRLGPASDRTHTGRDTPDAQVVEAAGLAQLSPVPSPILTTTPVDALAPTDALILEVLSRAAEAHGGPGNALAELARAPGVDFRYDRVLRQGEGTLSVHHQYTRAGAARRLRVDVQTGEGTDSDTVVTTGDKAWVKVKDVATVRDPAVTRTVVDRFSPEQVLAVPLVLATDLLGAAQWRALNQVSRESSPDGRRIVLRRSPTDTGDGLSAAAFDADTHQLAQVQWQTSTGTLEFEYSKYRTIGDGVVLPMDVRIRRDGDQIEHLQVVQLALRPLQPAEFSPPAEAVHPGG